MAKTTNFGWSKPTQVPAPDARGIARQVADLADNIDGAILGPQIIVPPASVIGTSALNTWFSANRAIVHRFTVPITTTVRYACFKIGTASGNIEVGIVRLSGTGHLSYTRVVTTGLIASPAAGNIRQDLGATVLTPGDYGVWFYADNATITTPNTIDNIGVVNAAKIAFDGGAGNALAASGTLTAGGRYIFGLTLEGDI